MQVNIPAINSPPPTNAGACPKCGRKAAVTQTGIVVIMILLLAGAVGIGVYSGYTYRDTYWQSLEGIWTPDKPREYGGEGP